MCQFNQSTTRPEKRKIPKQNKNYMKINIITEMEW